MSFLSTIGKVPKAIFTWLASPTGQAIVKTGEAVAIGIDPALAGIITIINNWVAKAISTEALAAAAGMQTGSGALKAAAVIGAMEPIVAQYFPAATQTQLANANTAIIAFLNAFDVTPAAPPAK